MSAVILERLTGVTIIAKRRFQKRRPEQEKAFRANHRIRVSPIRLIDENDEQVGVVETPEALRRAQEAKLDLVEVAPNAKPPVCRIIDYGKWKYQQKKREQKAKANTKHSELKEVRLRPGTDEHDLDIKIDKARAFFKDGHKVQFTILFRGRQMAHREIGFNLFRHITERFSDAAHVDMNPRVQGRRMTMTMAPGVRTTPPKAKDAPAPRAPAAAPPAAEPAPEPANQG